MSYPPGYVTPERRTQRQQEQQPFPGGFRRRGRYASPDAQIQGTWQPNEMTHAEGGPYAKSWHDHPGFTYDMAAGVPIAADWNFYVEVWRECPDPSHNARIDSAQFYVHLLVTMQPRAENVQYPFATQTGAPHAQLRVHPIVWETAGH